MPAQLIMMLLAGMRPVLDGVAAGYNSLPGLADIGGSIQVILRGMVSAHL